MKLYYNFPKYQNNIQKTLQNLFRIFAELDNDLLKKEAAINLCKIIYFSGTSKEFKETMQNDQILKPLLDCEYFDKKVLVPETNTLEAMTLD